MIFLSPFPNKSASENFCLTSFTSNKENTKHSPCSWYWWNYFSGGTCRWGVLFEKHQAEGYILYPSPHSDMQFEISPSPLLPTHTHTHTHTHTQSKWTQMAGTQSRHLGKQPQASLVAVISFYKYRKSSRCLCFFLIWDHSRFSVYPLPVGKCTRSIRKIQRLIWVK